MYIIKSADIQLLVCILKTQFFYIFLLTQMTCYFVDKLCLLDINIHCNFSFLRKEGITP